MHATGEQHLHLRKRVARKLEQYPNPDRFTRLYDGFMYLIGIATPLSSLPQLYEIWVQHNAAGVSFFSWAFFTIASLFWIIYGVIHHEKPIIVSQVLWFVLEGLIAIGILIYR